MEDINLLKAQYKTTKAIVESLRTEIKQLEEMLEISNQTVKDKQRIIELLTEKLNNL